MGNIGSFTLPNQVELRSDLRVPSSINFNDFRRSYLCNQTLDFKNSRCLEKFRYERSHIPEIAKILPSRNEISQPEVFHFSNLADFLRLELWVHGGGGAGAPCLQHCSWEVQGGERSGPRDGGVRYHSPRIPEYCSNIRTRWEKFASFFQLV